MSMEIHGGYKPSKTHYAEQVKEKQAAQREEKAKETNGDTNDTKVSNKTPDPYVEYISSEKSGAKPAGLYRIGQDENGNRKIFFDDPNKAGNADGRERSKIDWDGPDGHGGSRQPKADGDNAGKPAEKCITNTDKVDREIRRLKEKKQQLEQQIRAASGDKRKVRELERKLAQAESELSRKDNDTYRRQNASVSE